MAGRRVLNVLEDLINPDRLAALIAREYDRYWQARIRKELDWSEVSKYVFATDTSFTANSKLPWKNKTTRPKICQIRDNLHANYMAALSPTDEGFEGEPADKLGADIDKARAIKAYRKT